jgi:hypothetical protein
MDSPMKTTNGFLNSCELDEQRQAETETHYPYWLENDESDDLIFDDALYGVV